MSVIRAQAHSVLILQAIPMVEENNTNTINYDSRRINVIEGSWRWHNDPIRADDNRLQTE